MPNRRALMPWKRPRKVTHASYLVHRSQLSGHVALELANRSHASNNYRMRSTGYLDCCAYRYMI